ncbi:MAG: SAM-dependent methyltransferase [Gammaproteobacteria bacterium]|nr:SAM-dependent methyltransferase [Gammaproteobacteria bacterium]|tara:strand:+ start:277 stop:1053 length:777 start_codon:yes stop_codon:yes gene_type:complete
MDILDYNRRAWNAESEADSEWSTPVSELTINEARAGNWSVRLTPNKDVPREWFGNISGKNILCLASGGGQQAPVLAAAGARISSFDLSDIQLQKDRLIAERDKLEIVTEQGDMKDLSRFANAQFDLIFHPVSNVFIPDLRPLWQECCRVLKPAGRLLSGFMNPSYFLFDHYEAEASGELKVKFSLPTSEPVPLDRTRNKVLEEKGHAYEFPHSLEAQLGGQLAVGFSIRGLYEDDWSHDATPLNAFSPTTIATLAIKN